MADKFEKKFLEATAEKDMDFIDILRFYRLSYKDFGVCTERNLVAYAIGELFELLSKAGIDICGLQNEINEGDK